MANKNYQNEKVDESVSTKDFFVGALIGGIVGAMTALLLAPKSGKELRQNINSQTHMLKQKADQWKDSALEKGSELATVAKKKTDSITEFVSGHSQERATKMKSPLQDETKEKENSQAKKEHLYTAEDIEKKLAETKQSMDETEAQYR